MKKKILAIEVEKSEPCILVRNFVSGVQETRSSLRESFMRLLHFMKLETQVRVLDVFWFVLKDTQRPNLVSAFPAAKVVFSSKYEKLTFMSQLKVLRNSQYANLKTSDDVPKSQKPEFTKVDNAAYKIRQREKGTLTLFYTGGSQNPPW